MQNTRLATLAENEQRIQPIPSMAFHLAGNHQNPFIELTETTFGSKLDYIGWRCCRREKWLFLTCMKKACDMLQLHQDVKRENIWSQNTIGHYLLQAPCIPIRDVQSPLHHFKFEILRSHIADTAHFYLAHTAFIPSNLSDPFVRQTLRILALHTPSCVTLQKSSSLYTSYTGSS